MASKPKDSSGSQSSEKGGEKTPVDRAEESAEELDSETEQSRPMMQRAGSAVNPTGALSASAAQISNKMADTEPQPSPTGLMAYVGLGLTAFALASLCVAFASPYWYQTYPMSFNTFQNLGLWEVCMDNYMHHKDDSQEIYSGCWWVFNRDEKYWKLREWLSPPWFIACQVMVVGCLLIEVATLVIAGLVILHCCPLMNHEYHQTYGIFAAASMMFLVTMTTAIGAIVFATNCDDRNWMPRPDLNFISWGFGFYIISGIVALAAGVCFFMEARKAYDELMSKEEEFTKAALEMSGYPPSMGYPPPGVFPPPSYMSQPSYGSQHSYETQPTYDMSREGYGLPPKA